MQAKFKILLCVMVMLGLAVSQVNAQIGLDVEVTPNSVVQEGQPDDGGVEVYTYG
jgi:hypothetical protein